VEHSELEPIVTMLIDSWRGDVQRDPARWNACRKLDELLRSFLSPDFVRRARRAPKKYRVEVRDALGQLITQDPAAERLAKILLGDLQPVPHAPSVVLPSIAIHGSNNQISVGPHLGTVTQIMNPPSGDQRQQKAADAVVQDEPNQLLFKLMLLQRGDDVIEVRAIQTPSQGQPHATIQAPYMLEELDAVLVMIDDSVTGRQSSTEYQREILRRHNLLSSPQQHRRMLERIGHHLYERLFVGDVRSAFQSALNLAHQQGHSLRLQLCMDEDSVMLARFPWELLHDGRRPLLASKAIELTRSIAYSESPMPLNLELPLRLLYVGPRPTNLPPLPRVTDHSRVPEYLRALERSGVLCVTELARPTYTDLVDHVQHNRVQILHFDGHGSFGRRCRCRVHAPHCDVCPTCGANLVDIPPEGYLAFEDRTYDTHLVPSSTLGTILYSCSIQVGVLLACSSGVVHGDTLFTGVGPALVQAGVPAVIATQSTISSDAANVFAETFYQSLTRREPIAMAVNHGRQQLLLHQEWFIPVLYLRDAS